MRELLEGVKRIRDWNVRYLKDYGSMVRLGKLIREFLLEKGLIRKVSLSPFPPLCFIDSSNKALTKTFLGEILYGIVIAGYYVEGKEKKRKGYKGVFINLSETEFISSDDDISLLINNVALVEEILHGSRVLKEGYLPVMDGSPLTFVRAVEYLKERDFYDESPILYSYLDRIEEVERALGEVLERAVFFPKRTGKKDFALLLAENGLISREKALAVGITDYKLLHFALKTGEYVVLPSKREPRDYKAYWNIGERMQVVYFKGLSGRIYRGEGVFTSWLDYLFPSFLKEGENFFTYSVDRYAKKCLNYLSSSVIRLGEYRI